MAGIVGSEVVEGLGKALWKSGVPDELMETFVKTPLKDAGNMLDAIGKDAKVADELRVSYTNTASPDPVVREGGHQALTAIGGLTNDISKTNSRLDLPEQLTKKQQAAKASAERLQTKQQESLDRLNPEKPGKPSRQDRAFVRGGPEAPASYQQHLIEPLKKNVDETGAVQVAKGDAHHVDVLEYGAKVTTNHGSYQDLKPNEEFWMVDTYRRLNIELANNEKNIASVLENNTLQSRRERISLLEEQTGGVVHRDTINSRLSVSKFKPAELTDEQAVALNLFKKQNPGKTRADFEVKWKEQTGKTLPVGSLGPDIVVYKPDGTTGANRTELGRVSLNSEADKAGAMSSIFDILDANDIDTTAARKAYDMQKIKIDRNLEIYGSDHGSTHSHIDLAAETKGTGLYAVEEAIQNGTIKNMPRAEAFKLDFNQLRDMENILGNHLIYRYKKIKKLWETGGSKNYKPSRIPWNQLPPGAKLNFYMLNLNRIAVLGGNEKGLSLKQALKSVTEWEPGLVEIFGWTPQTMNITDEAVEEAAKRIFEPNPVWKMTDADKAAHMEGVIKKLHETNYQTSGMGDHTQVESLGK